ncbi:glycosyltransferase [Sphingobacterium detergens]|uniref:Glycosyltransferase involved in cell wall biosynthesis n=1 Tax=Sphingobacterium detergens TaxID=1145106 RepID=A0A420BK84_SPHD1|nr:glycosyltransferase [Sphingobacterium detergens]RKE57194.1 glycosyltransferase involved in cell wall biosynthesis [Sphingobacterium detergens]
MGEINFEYSPLDRIINYLTLCGAFENVDGLNGKLGIAIFLYEAGKMKEYQYLNDLSDLLVEETYSSLGTNNLYDFESGITGIGVGLLSLNERGNIEFDDIDESFEEIDEMIFDHPSQSNSFLVDNLLYLLFKAKTSVQQDDTCELIKEKINGKIDLFSISGECYQSAKILVKINECLLNIHRLNIKYEDILTNAINSLHIIERNLHCHEYLSYSLILLNQLEKMYQRDILQISKEKLSFICTALKNAFNNCSPGTKLNVLANLYSHSILFDGKFPSTTDNVIIDPNTIEYQANQAIKNKNIEILIGLGHYLLSSKCLIQTKETDNKIGSNRPNVVMILPETEALNYGIGSYIDSIEKNAPHNQFNLHLIYIKPSFEEFEMSLTKFGSFHYYLPINLLTDGNTNANKQKSIQFISHFLLNRLTRLENLVFHINYLAAYEYIKVLRQKLTFRLISVIHFSSRDLYLNGNLTTLDKIWKDRKKKIYSSNNYENLIAIFNMEEDLYFNSNHIVVVNQYLFNSLVKYYNVPKTKISVIENGLKLEDNIHENNTMLRQHYNITKEDTVIIFTGRLSYQKGVDKLISAFRKILHVHPNTYLFIIGDLQDKTFVLSAKDIESKVIFTGHIDKDIIRRFYSIADLYVIPSLFEGCPYSVLEAMSYSLPIVATDTIGLNELLTDRFNCLHSKININKNGDLNVDEEDLYKKIVTLIKNKGLALRLGSNAFLTFNEKYHCQSMIDALQKVYQTDSFA